jgi:formylglycine-generating enzyme required for sulfatase activity
MKAQGKKIAGLGLLLAALGLGSPCFLLPENKSGGGGGDEQAPVAEIVSPADGFATNLMSVSIAGTSTDKHTVTSVVVFGCRDGNTPDKDGPCYPQMLWAGTLDGGKVAPVVAASLTGDWDTWQALLSFYGGGGQTLDYAIKVATMDDRGNYNAKAAGITVTIDLSGPDIYGPELALLSPQEGQVIGAAAIPVRGYARDLNTVASVTVDPGTGPVSATDLGIALPFSSWRADVPLAAGANTLTVVASDDQVPPNTTTAIVHVTQDQKGNMVLVATPTAFTMGYSAGTTTEQPEHTVNLSPYYVDQYEVTQQDYKLCFDALIDPLNPVSHYCPLLFSEDWVLDALMVDSELIPIPGRELYPVRGIDKYSAEIFCNWNGGKRLLTEAEWERAGRAGATGPDFMPDGRIYPFGAAIDCTLANIKGCVGHPTPVGSYPANPLGIYDLAGNVMEWVEDFYQDDYYSVLKPLEPVTDPVMGTVADSTCQYNTVHCIVNRGGAYTTSPVISRSSFRNYYDDPVGDPAYGGAYQIGFRCALDGP